MERTRTALMLVVLGYGCAAWAQTPASQQNQGGCYDQDANGKQVFLPNCGLPAAPEKTKQPNLPGAPSNAAPANPAQQFPFPGEPSQAPSPQSPTGQPADPAKAFPFPGEDNTPVVQPDGSVVPASPKLKDAGSSGESSSSSSGSSDSGISGLPPDPNKGPLDEDPDAVLKKPRRKERDAPVQTPSEREAEDLSVAGFYMDDLNYRGAFLRASDAVTVAGDDPNAHFALAEAARKLGKLDQAEAEYKKTLTLDPVPKQKKAAEKALKEMSGGG